ncbi:unnamed protein product [Mycena citricolor]|uniref:Adenylate kinase n=1 Tax=Mycena citricolor TaxID=2018698 RepID=A0AAD2K1C3_9AGAR|nr:unnamed protein product [Mycena citricolor]
MKSYIDKGHLAPDELVIDIITEYVCKHKDCKGNVFDGFPRTTPQAEAFDKIMEMHGAPINLILSLEVPDEELIKRILLRSKDSAGPTIAANRSSGTGSTFTKLKRPS